MKSLVYLKVEKSDFVRFWKLLFAVSYSTGLTKCDVILDIFSTRNNVYAELLSIILCTGISNMYTT